MRLSVFVSLLALVAVTLVSVAVARSPADSRGWSRPPGDPVDSAAAEISSGRYWHAARILRPLREDGQLGSEGLLLLATAEAGYQNWTAVREVLEGAGWLDGEGGGHGWRLLGRALEEVNDLAASVEAYSRYLDSDAAGLAWDRDAVRARMARVLARDGRAAEARGSLGSMAAGSPLGSWLALDMATALAEEGDAAAVEALWPMIDAPAARRRGWELVPRARLEAGDSAGAETAYLLATDSIGDAAGRARAWTAIGSLRLASGDTLPARAAYLEALGAAGGSSVSSPAAARLLDLGIAEEGLALQAAVALDRGGDIRRALDAYDLVIELSPNALPYGTRLNRARLLSLDAGRHGEAISEFRELAEVIDDRELGVRNLNLWADLRRRQGRTGDVATIREWILERYPESSEAVETIFLRGDASHDRGALGEALEDYSRLQDMNSSLDRSGLARMRMGQIHLRRGDPAAARAVYEDYLAEFPGGRRWDEATYWVGRIMLETGDTASGRTVLREMGERNALSYYAVKAAELLGEPYRLPAFAEEEPTTTPDWLAQDLLTLDLLEQAGLELGHSSMMDDLTERGESSPDGVVVALARELLARGATIEAINLGWALRDRGKPWSRALIEITYPFLFRDMVERAAANEGLDPIVVAALMRQESAFDADIVSPAGAVGLMQVMPATGREVARASGLTDFSVGSLEAPDLNLHLGTHFLREMWNRYDGNLILVLSAYNAGPTRANAWRSFPEAADPVLFTDRIPFRETRDYVKLVTRNVAIYRALYGDA